MNALPLVDVSALVDPSSAPQDRVEVGRRIDAAFGPTQASPAASTASANPAFSERNP